MDVDDAKIKAARYGMLSEFALLIAQADNLDQLLQKLTSNLKWLLSFERCAIAIRNEDGETFRYRTLAESRRNVPAYSDDALPLENGASIAMSDSSKPRILNQEEIAGNKPDDPVDPILWDGSLATLMLLPLKAYGETLGALILGTSKREGYDSEDLRVGTTIATHLALAIERWQQKVRQDFMRMIE